MQNSEADNTFINAQLEKVCLLPHYHRVCSAWRGGHEEGREQGASRSSFLRYTMSNVAALTDRHCHRFNALWH